MQINFYCEMPEKKTNARFPFPLLLLCLPFLTIPVGVFCFVIYSAMPVLLAFVALIIKRTSVYILWNKTSRKQRFQPPKVFLAKS